MKLKATQLRKGMIIEHNDELYQLTDVFHNTPGKGQASVQTKMKNIRTGVNAEKRYRSDERTEGANYQGKQGGFVRSGVGSETQTGIRRDNLHRFSHRSCAKEFAGGRGFGGGGSFIIFAKWTGDGSSSGFDTYFSDRHYIGYYLVG